MTENYGLITETIQNVDLRAGDHPVVTIPATIASGATLAKGTVLGRNATTNYYSAYSATNTDGTQVPRAVLTRDVDASTQNMPAGVIVHGEVNKNALTGLDLAAIYKLQEFGIYVKEVK